MIRSVLSAFLIVALSIGTASSQSGERQMESAGVWRPGAAEADGAQCKRIWHCASDVNIPLKAGEEVSYSPIAKTGGQCADIDCRKCAAPAPTEICAWKIVEKTPPE